VARLLVETLNEEKAADKKLSALAESGINDAARSGLDDEED
jgi:ferritin-like metal-binding protein YciE